MIAWNLKIHETLPSTQDAVKLKAAENADEGLAVQALSQTDGHGRHGRTWTSEPGNLYISFLLRPQGKADSVGQLSILTAVALAETIKDFISESLIQLKWPNDLLINGKKCAGILLETNLAANAMLEWVVVGMGINVKNAPEGAAHLSEYASVCPSLEKLREVFFAKFEAIYDEWQKTGFEAIRSQWLDLAHKPGDPLQVKIGVNIKKGAFYDMDMQGNMLLKTGNKEIITITSGEVYI